MTVKGGGASWARKWLATMALLSMQPPAAALSPFHKNLPPALFAACGPRTISRRLIYSPSCVLAGRVACDTAATVRRIKPLLAGVGTSADEKQPMLFGLPRDDVARPLLLLLAAQFILFIGVGAIIPSLPLYSKAIGLSSAANGIVLSAPAVALLLGAGPAGRLADRARKPAMMGGMALIAASDAGTALAPSIVPLLIARLGLGAGRCVSESGERGMLADLAGRAPDSRGRALASQQAVTALGIAIGAPLGGIVVENYGPRASFLCVTAGALVALVAYAFLPETVLNAGGSHGTVETLDADLSLTVVSNPDADDADFVRRWSQLLKDNQWKGISLFECGARFGFAAKLASIPVLATASLPGGAAGAGALLSAAGLTGLVGAPAGGWLTDRAGARATAVASGIVSASGLFLIPFALSGELSAGFLGTLPGFEGNSSAATFSVLVLLWGLGTSAQGPAVTALSQQIAPQGEEATALALPRAAGDATFIVAPFALGLVADKASAGYLPFGAECAAAGTMSILGVLALAILCKPKHV